MVFKTIAILGILIGIGRIIQYNNQCQNELKEYQALQIFLKIDDIGHESITNTRKRWADYDSWAWIAEFEQIDNRFHDTKDITEKLKCAKEMAILFEKIDAYIHQIWGLTTPQDIARDKKYHEIYNLFKQF